MANGLYTNSELLDSIIVDLDKLMKALFSGQYIKVCAIVTGMVQKLSNLRKNLDNDLKNREETIEALKQELKNAGRGVEDMTPKEFMNRMADGQLVKDGAQND